MVSSMAYLIAIVAIIQSSKSSTYDETKALDALYYSYGAYCSAKTINNWSCDWCKYTTDFQIKYVISGNSLQAFIGYDPIYSQIVVSFRGTMNNANRLADVAEGFLPYDNAPDSKPYNVHYGIYTSYKSLEELGLPKQINAVIAKYPNSDILVTGHSLGGALAAITALEMKATSPFYESSRKSMKNVNLITFGSPKWCNNNLVQYFNRVMDSSFRVVNKNDVIPANPPGWLGYGHVGVEIRYTNNDPLTYKVCEAPYGVSQGCHYGISVPDHLNYFGIKLYCSTSNDKDGKMGMFGMDSSRNAALKSSLSDVDDDESLPTMDVIVVAVVILGVLLVAVLFGAYFYWKRRTNTKGDKQLEEYHEMNDTMELSYVAGDETSEAI